MTSYRTISISVILHALAIAHRSCFTDGETLTFVSRSCPFAKDEPDALTMLGWQSERKLQSVTPRIWAYRVTKLEVAA